MRNATCCFLLLLGSWSTVNGQGSPTISPPQIKARVLHNFNGKDGIAPDAGLIFDASGNLYGTTSGGGAYNHGAVFELSPTRGGTWKEKVLHSFNLNGKDGYDPVAGLTLDVSGNLYGTTFYGGSHGFGAVFELSPDANGKWTERVLYSFCSVAGCSDGEWPHAGMILDKTGNLYGTTPGDGIHTFGSVFELTAGRNDTWTYSVLYAFQENGRDGFMPFAGLVFGADGSLYGTTPVGGHGYGTVFELTPAGNGKWTEKILHKFNSKDGFSPISGLVFDASGNLYGTTSMGGSSSNCDYGCGTVFELTPDTNGKWTEKVLHSFTGNGEDGISPCAGLIFDASGDLYGTTLDGGNYNSGSVFELSTRANGRWVETMLHSFDGRDGNLPFAGVILDASGNLYGTTYGGGAYGDGYGTVFELTP